MSKLRSSGNDHKFCDVFLNGFEPVQTWTKSKLFLAYSAVVDTDWTSLITTWFQPTVTQLMKDPIKNIFLHQNELLRKAVFNNGFFLLLFVNVSKRKPDVNIYDRLQIDEKILLCWERHFLGSRRIMKPLMTEWNNFQYLLVVSSSNWDLNGIRSVISVRRLLKGFKIRGALLNAFPISFR